MAFSIPGGDAPDRSNRQSPVAGPIGIIGMDTLLERNEVTLTNFLIFAAHRRGRDFVQSDRTRAISMRRNTEFNTIGGTLL
jgi:hypothetical protein